MCTLGMAAEYKKTGIGVNSLWPLTAIDTAAVRNLLGGDAMTKMSRKPEIMADAAHVVLSRAASDCSGNFFIDEEVLRESGVTDFDQYAHEPGGQLAGDFFVPDDVFDRVPTKVLRSYN